MQIEAFHPGEFLLEELEARKLKKKDFAKAIGVLPTNLSEIFKGKRSISVKTALKIEKELGVSAEYWLNMQLLFDLQNERRKGNNNE